MTDNFTFNYTGNNLSDTLIKEVVAFWMTEGAIKNEETAKKRAESLIGVVKQNDKIVGVATATKTTYSPIKKYVFLYKTYISAEHRRKGLMKKLFNYLFKEIEGDSNHTDIAGILAVIEPIFLNMKKSTIWEDYGNAFLFGYDPRGFQIRLAYFPNRTL